VLPIGVEQIPESGLIASGNLFEPFYVKGIVLHTVVSLVKLAIKNNTGQVTVGDTAPKLADIFRTGNFFDGGLSPIWLFFGNSESTFYGYF
jgi:hypothetical protein